jgi:hypothetical protein
MPADAANLDYADKETVLALDHLEHMSDEAVRDTLGWSPQQKRGFLDRWRGLYREAESSQDDSARLELEKSLRGLGLRPQHDRLERGGASGDTLRGVQDSSLSRPPAEYRELFNAFKRGTARAEADQPNE